MDKVGKSRGTSKTQTGKPFGIKTWLLWFESGDFTNMYIILGIVRNEMIPRVLFINCVFVIVYWYYYLLLFVTYYFLLKHYTSIFFILINSHHPRFVALLCLTPFQQYFNYIVAVSFAITKIYPILVDDVITIWVMFISPSFTRMAQAGW